METENSGKLVQSNRGLAATVKSLSKPSELTLLNELDLTATNSKTVMEPRLSAEFLRVLSDFPAEAVEYAFRAWRDESPFFPSVSEIRGLCQAWVRRKSEERELQERAEQRKEVAEARERGELVEWVDVVRKFKEISDAAKPEHFVKAMPEPPREIVITPEKREIVRQQIEKAKAMYGKRSEGA